jgi:cupin 2 domain-containing protein
MKGRGNLFDGLDGAGAGDGERFDDLLCCGSTRIERIVSQGHRSTEGFWYEQEEPEWVLVVSGSARLRLEDPDEVVDLSPGDWLLIPAMRRHRVEGTSPDGPTVWLAVWAMANGHEPMREKS